MVKRYLLRFSRAIFIPNTASAVLYYLPYAGRDSSFTQRLRLRWIHSHENAKCASAETATVYASLSATVGRGQ